MCVSQQQKYMLIEIDLRLLFHLTRDSFHTFDNKKCKWFNRKAKSKTKAWLFCYLNIHLLFDRPYDTFLLEFWYYNDYYLISIIWQKNQHIKCRFWLLCTEIYVFCEKKMIRSLLFDDYEGLWDIIKEI